MEGTLRAIGAEPRLGLQLVVTGIHLDRAHGRTIDRIRGDGWRVDAVVPWRPAGGDLVALARETGKATGRLAAAFAKLEPDVVLVVGDRVEAFAAATAAHLSGRVVAHVHGGDRALGQVDDALRHAITKLAHLHFPATQESAERLRKLGEDGGRIYRVGSPGLDGIHADAWPLSECVDVAGELSGSSLRKGRYALVLLHPTDADDSEEQRGAELLLRTTRSVGFDNIVVLHPNNDPGSAGILRAWEVAAADTQYAARDTLFVKDLPRPAFLGLLRDAACLVGNSSAGIIEAASFGTPVVDVGPRQAGRQRGENVTGVPFRRAPIRDALAKSWNGGRPRRHARRNIYGAGDTARRIAGVLASVPITPALRRKLIAY